MSPPGVERISIRRAASHRRLVRYVLLTHSLPLSSLSATIFLPSRSRSPLAPQSNPLSLLAFSFSRSYSSLPPP
eukprot:1502517-Rhodomonas_salina.1